ncbi:flagellar hook-basal body protein [Paenibacillus sp. N3/727]|uniref:flagellar hook-basal body protein n=1 Tax=Paenibacillus sp. N3/727 TaxID=2925845 RepID=UPI001F52FB10|nr:flagellar hook-basal body protein [Paenibacillus sp. N3/727]UNK18097.1 flagellar hook-basal body protein [Paenibacillus sp. N3/727]
MLRGLYNAAAGMITQQRRHDTITQNIVNVNTTGYKQTDSVQRSFPEVLVSMIGGEPGNEHRTLGKLSTAVFAEESLSLHKQGALRETGKTSDFAIVSELGLVDPATGENMSFDASGKYIDGNGEVIYRPQAFFTVQDENGEVRYTRNGQFHVSQDGNLLTSTGYQVLDADNAPIVLTGQAGNFTVNEQGQIVGVAGNPTGVTLGISVVDKPHALVREGNGVFRLNSTDGDGTRFLAAGDNAIVRQGFIEASNVDPSQSMVELTAALRAYETNQKVVQFYDKSLEKAVNEIGRV